MRIALLAPLPPEQTGIADYAAHLRSALREQGLEVLTPLEGCLDLAQQLQRLQAFDWRGVDLVHAELGGGRFAEFQALDYLRRTQPQLPLTATVHDPERLIWRRAKLFFPLTLLERLPHPLPQAAALLADPLTLYEERRLAKSMRRLITLTRLGGDCLRQRMGLKPEQVAVIAHGNLPIAPVALPPLQPLRLLYFGFIYRGKGIEDLLQALARTLAAHPQCRGQVRLTLAGGTAPEMTFDPAGNYLDGLRQLIATLHLSDVVDWQLDLPSADIPHTIQAHHVMVLPYRESKKLGFLGQMRGTSGALSWANACGRGVITSNARAFAEEVAGGNGITYQQGDIASLSDALSRLILDPQQARQWADHAADIGRQRQWASTAQRFAELFQAVVKEPLR
ncbi:glycosyltransferase [Pseudomonas proteolytica]|uniref:Glycosyltransferase n=1 Tax=Pseudomonas proteolytica TaxID=219574 RepID=A0AAW5A8X1_9PSED|nr:glycosyltransferase [Pseudomonas proteolytica]KAA8703889.1 glycosyltransferase [Pseudomonas proteolytica]MCF5057794.1 glycosyltransferase [Pseudomonas proteolytica]MCF5100730.1 glycosyltransferase [Pseudomonas proteolytica]TWR82851.1 glycosyltransferase [Pseudomonas proteolytica]SEE12697.1 Glycosyltransferase involved in cell wall bisynthesis [Pseudomonas proteolytica]